MTQKNIYPPTTNLKTDQVFLHAKNSFIIISNKKRHKRDFFLITYGVFYKDCYGVTAGSHALVVWQKPHSSVVMR